MHQAAAHANKASPKMEIIAFQLIVVGHLASQEKGTGLTAVQVVKHVISM